MKSKIMVIFMAAIFAAGFGTTYAGEFIGDGDSINIDVQAEVVGAEVTVTNGDALNFGQILPPGTGDGSYYVAIDLGDYTGGTDIGTDGASVSNAQSRASNAVVSNTNTDSSSFQNNEITPNTDILINGPRTPGGFTMETNYDTSVEVTIEDGITLENTSSATLPDTMALTDIRDCSNIDGDGITPEPVQSASVFHVWIGGVLEVHENQASGDYSPASGGINVSLAFE